MPDCIAASIPGRLRLRDGALRDPQHNARVCAALRERAAVRHVEGKPQAASVVLSYDPEGAAPAVVEAWAAGLVAALRPATAWPRAAHDPSGTPRVRANRLAKRGMLGSLALSLLLAAVGSKRWHALAGGHYLLFLAIHLWVHRRHLLR